MRGTIFDADLEQDVWEEEADAGRSIEAYRPPLPELPVRAGEDEDAEDELLDASPYPQPGEWGFE